MIRYLYALSLLFSVSALAQPAIATNTIAPGAGSIGISFETQPYGGKYSPKHVLAAWVVDAQGQHVKTLTLYGAKQLRRLATWRESFGKNKLDATTGATRKQHEKVEVVWDGTDQNGKAVPDGTYKLVLEYTETNKQGPVLGIEIEKRKGLGVTEAPKESKYFRNISIRLVKAIPKE